jgi:hypothetical protein
MIYIVLMKKGIGIEFMYNFILLVFGLVVAMLLFAFYIADIWGRLFIAVVLLFTSILMFIIKSEPMHNFILYLDHSGITNSIYWIIYVLSLPILILVTIPIRNATIGKSLTFKLCTIALLMIIFTILALPMLANFVYKFYPY